MAKRWMVAAGVLLVPGMGCTESGAKRPAPPPKESSTQPPVRNSVLKTDISWQFDYQPADPNGAGVWTREVAPSRLLAALSEEGRADGNSFVAGGAGASAVILRGYEYTDGGKEKPRDSPRAEAWGRRHPGMALSGST